MSQISPPFRILLVCAAAFLVAWMAFLRPGAEPAVPAAGPGNVAAGEPAVSDPGAAAQAAQAAVDASNAQLEAQQGVDGVDAGEVAAAAGTATGTTAARAAGANGLPAGGLKGVPKPVARAIRDDKVVVLLFWNRESADDRLVRDAVRDVNRRDGRVYVHNASIGSISRFGKVTRGADVEQSPTVVVVDPELRAETLVGFVDAPTVDQAVVDAFRNTTGFFRSDYLRSIHDVCSRFASAAFSAPRSDNPRQYAAAIDDGATQWARFSTAFAAVPAPKRHAGLRAATVRDNRAWQAVLDDEAAFLGASPSLETVVAADARFASRRRAISKRHVDRMDDANVLACGSNR